MPPAVISSASMRWTRIWSPIGRIAVLADLVAAFLGAALVRVAMGLFLACCVSSWIRLDAAPPATTGGEYGFWI